MKIINNNKEELFLQLKDITFLHDLDFDIPDDIYKIIFANFEDYRNRNKNTFIKFEDQSVINFINSLDFIISWTLYSELSMEDVLNDIRHGDISYRALIKGYNRMSDVEKEYDAETLNNIKKLNHKLNDLKDILDYKNGKSNIPFPLEPDYYGFKYATTRFEYGISQAIDPNIMLLFRLDNKLIDSLEGIPYDFVNVGLSVAAMEGINEEYLSGKYDITYDLSDDKKYVIIKYHIKDYYKEHIIEGPKIGGFVNKMFK